MTIALSLLVLLLSYLLGSVPFGLLIVWLKTGQDVRKVQSGRTGGTNVMRAAGFLPGLATAILDVLKGAATVWLARILLPGIPWLEATAPLMAILGHNYSIFLAERNENGGWRLRGGAGGATTVGGAMGLWPPSLFIILPVGLIFLFGIGYASLATMSVALTATVIFAYRAVLGISPWAYVFYGLAAEALLIWSLRPNIRRLLNGTERVVGWRAQRRKQEQE